VLAQQDVERAIHDRQQRDRLALARATPSPTGSWACTCDSTLTRNAETIASAEPGHRRAHHAHKLEDGVLAKHRLRRRQAGKEIGELLAQDALASCRLWKPRGAVDLQKLLLRDPRALHASDIVNAWPPPRIATTEARPGNSSR